MRFTNRALLFGKQNEVFTIQSGLTESVSLGKPFVFIVLERRLLVNLYRISMQERIFLRGKALHLYSGTHSISMQEPKVITIGDDIDSAVMHIVYLNSA